MKIGIIGIRGIPVIYSAFETFAEVLSTQLVKKHYMMFVYCRKGVVQANKKSYKGVHLVVLPHLASKNLSTLFHSFLSTLHACLWGKYDVILYLGVGSTMYSFIPRFFGIKTVVHIDGMDWKRKKWNWVGKSFLKLSEYLTTIFPNDVITDSHFMVRYYKQRYKKNIQYIPYGYFEIRKDKGSEVLLKKYNIKKRNYFVWVGRFVPENHIEDFLSAIALLQKKKIPSLILGDDLYNSDYKRKVYSLIQENKQIVFPGFIKHDDVLTLEANSLAYIETKRSGGTHVSLVEAMGTGTLIISHANQANRDVLGNTALFYDNTKKTTSLALTLNKVINNPERYKQKRNNVKLRAKKYYSWNSVIKSYEHLFTNLKNM